MKRSLLYVVALLCLINIGFSEASSRKAKVLYLHVGSIKTVEVGSVTRVAVGIDSLLGTSILDNGQLLLIPKKQVKRISICGKKVRDLKATES